MGLHCVSRLHTALLCGGTCELFVVLCYYEQFCYDSPFVSSWAYTGVWDFWVVGVCMFNMRRRGSSIPQMNPTYSSLRTLGYMPMQL